MLDFSNILTEYSGISIRVLFSGTNRRTLARFCMLWILYIQGDTIGLGFMGTLDVWRSLLWFL